MFLFSFFSLSHTVNYTVESVKSVKEMNAEWFELDGCSGVVKVNHVFTALDASWNIFGLKIVKIASSVSKLQIIRGWAT